MKRFERYEENRKRNNEKLLNKTRRQKYNRTLIDDMRYISYDKGVGKWKLQFDKYKYHGYFDNLDKAKAHRNKELNIGKKYKKTDK